MCSTERESWCWKAAQADFNNSRRPRCCWCRPGYCAVSHSNLRRESRQRQGVVFWLLTCGGEREMSSSRLGPREMSVTTAPVWVEAQDMSSKLQLRQGARESEVCVSSSECGDNGRPQNWEKQSWQSRGAACGRVTAWANWALLPDNILLRSHWFSFPRIIHTVTFSLCCATQSPHTQKLCNYAALFILTIIKERSYFVFQQGCIKFIKRDRKGNYNIAKDLFKTNAALLNFYSSKNAQKLCLYKTIKWQHW